MKHWWLTLMFLAFTAAQAQTVWRCGPDGREYSNTPCPAGKPVDTTQPRPDADVRSAQSRAAQEKAQAAALLRERQSREASQGKGAAGIAPAKPPASAASSAKAKSKAKKKQPPADDGTWRAVAPASRQKKD